MPSCSFYSICCPIKPSGLQTVLAAVEIGQHASNPSTTQHHARRRRILPLGPFHSPGSPTYIGFRCSRVPISRVESVQVESGGNRYRDNMVEVPEWRTVCVLVISRYALQSGDSLTFRATDLYDMAISDLSVMIAQMDSYHNFKESRLRRLRRSCHRPVIKHQAGEPPWRTICLLLAPLTRDWQTRPGSNWHNQDKRTD